MSAPDVQVPPGQHGVRSAHACLHKSCSRGQAVCICLRGAPPNDMANQLGAILPVGYHPHGLGVPDRACRCEYTLRGSEAAAVLRCARESRGS